MSFFLMLHRVSDFDAHHRLFVACVVSGVVFLLMQGRVSLPTQLIAAWNAYAICTLALAWNTFISAGPHQIRKTAQQQDLSRTIVFFVVIISACTSLFAVGLLLGPAKAVPSSHLTSHIVLSVIAVISSWCLMHTMFTLRYAHLFYYQESDAAPAVEQAGGLEFPQEMEPDYLDFAYFAFVVGMTCQVSDVEITSRPMRHLALLHGVLSFAFNTVILALSINVISGLLER